MSDQAGVGLKKKSAARAVGRLHRPFPTDKLAVDCAVYAKQRYSCCFPALRQREFGFGALPMSRRIAIFFALLLGFLPAAVGAEQASPLWIAVTTAALRPAVEPLCEHRRADGMDVHVVITDELANATAGDLVSRIKHEIETLRGDRSTTTFVL